MSQPVMESVASSSIEAIGYDPATSELHVRFLSGRTYVYLDVPETLYASLLTAGSIGRHLNHFVRPRFEYRAE